MDQPEAVLTIPQRKSLFTEGAADARDGGLYRSISALIPPWFELAFMHAKDVSRTAIDFAPFFLASANQERAFGDDDMGEYKYADFDGQSEKV